MRKGSHAMGISGGTRRTNEAVVLCGQGPCVALGLAVCGHARQFAWSSGITGSGRSEEKLLGHIMHLNGFCYPQKRSWLMQEAENQLTSMFCTNKRR